MRQLQGSPHHHRHHHGMEKKMIIIAGVVFFLSIRTLLEPLKQYSISGQKNQNKLVFAFKEVQNTTTLRAAEKKNRKKKKSLSRYAPPRVILLPYYYEASHDIDNHVGHVPKVKIWPESADEHFRSNSSATARINDDDAQYRDFERHWYEDCQPIGDFPIHPTCNSIHEINFFQSTQISLLSMDGSWRSVWKVDEFPLEDESSHEDGNSPLSSLIFKALHTHRDYTTDSFAAHAMDSIVMERLAASPNVVSSFGYCGQSVITEFAKSSGRTVLKTASLSWVDRIRLARNLARGLAEIHALQHIPFGKHDKQNRTPLSPFYFAHHDINIANIVSVNPPRSIQWNDFNLGILLRNDPVVKSSQCDVPIRYAGPAWRSPEEVRNETGTLHDIQAADVYSLGNILFAVLTKRQPWSHLEEPQKPPESVIQALKQNGTLPNLPTRKKFVDRPEAQVIWEANKACFQFHPEDRPTAYELAQALAKAMDWFRGESRNKSYMPTTKEIHDLFSIRRPK